MPSAPFGQHPTVSEYVEWAKKECGCTVKQGIANNGSGTVSTVWLISAPDGKFVSIVATWDERLITTKVAQLDRRLGFDSPFPSL